MEKDRLACIPFVRAVLVAVGLSGCGGSSSSNNTTHQVPDCFTELTADGAYTDQGVARYGCALSYARDATRVILGGQIPGGDPALVSIQVEVDGLDESLSSGTLLASVFLTPAVGGPTWQSGAGGCDASIESQSPSVESWTLATATVTCSAPLVEQGGATEVNIRHLRLRSLYGPAH